jgi:UDP-2,3-diacylglucosamine pyrophosphatase LpxH
LPGENYQKRPNNEHTETRMSEASRRIAREARRRIELIASRIPYARTFLKQAEEPVVADRVVVISDLHFGNPFAALNNDGSLARLLEALRGMGQIDELVLLGDIFDFWQATFPEAVEFGRGLMSALFQLNNVGRMIYVPGNHDHRVVRLYLDELVSRNLRAGELGPIDLTIPMVEDCPAMQPLKPAGASVPLYMTYPWHRVAIQGREALLTHGQLLGFFEQRFWRPRRQFLNAFLLKRNPSVGLDDIEKFIAPYYELVALSTEVPGVIDGRYRFYRLISRTARTLGVEREYRVSAERNRSIEQNAVEIEALLEHFCEEKPAYFVYGHTHQAGALELPLSGTLAINSGSWLDDSGDENPRHTIVEITNEARIIDLQAPSG